MYFLPHELTVKPTYHWSCDSIVQWAGVFQIARGDLLKGGEIIWMGSYYFILFFEQAVLKKGIRTAWNEMEPTATESVGVE